MTVEVGGGWSCIEVGLEVGLMADYLRELGL